MSFWQYSCTILLLCIIDATATLKQNKKVNYTDIINNFFIFFFNKFISYLFLVNYFTIVLSFFSKNTFFKIESNSYTFILCFVLVDFFYYLNHFLFHKINFLWKAHLIHHSSKHFNPSTTVRGSWLNSLFYPYIFIPLCYLGFSPLLIATCFQLIQWEQALVHTENIKKLGWLENIFITPSSHRIHHSCIDENRSFNFGGLFVFWDKIFCTFKKEETKCEKFGLKNFVASSNPIVLCLESAFFKLNKNDGEKN